MKKSTRIWICITGVLLVVLGVLCIAKPTGTLFATAWLIGLFTLLSGISLLVFTIRTQAYIPNSGSRMLSALLQIILGCVFLSNKFFLSTSLPVVFAMWVLIQGVIIAVNSFDYKRAGFPLWWVIMVLGLCAGVLGVLGLRNPVAAGKTLSLLIGLAVISTGLSYLVAMAALNRFRKRLDGIKDALTRPVDEQ